MDVTKSLSDLFYIVRDMLAKARHIGGNCYESEIQKNIDYAFGNDNGNRCIGMLGLQL